MPMYPRRPYDHRVLWTKHDQTINLPLKLILSHKISRSSSHRQFILTIYFHSSVHILTYWRVRLHAHMLVHAQTELRVLLVARVKGHLHVSLPMRWNQQLNLRYWRQKTTRTPQASSTIFFKIYSAHFRLTKNQGIFSLSSDFLKEGEALKAAKRGKLVRISFEKMRRLNNHSWLKASDAEKKRIKANLSTLLNHRIKDFEDRV